MLYGLIQRIGWQLLFINSGWPQASAIQKPAFSGSDVPHGLGRTDPNMLDLSDLNKAGLQLVFDAVVEALSRYHCSIQVFGP